MCSGCSIRSLLASTRYCRQSENSWCSTKLPGARCLALALACYVEPSLKVGADGSPQGPSHHCIPIRHTAVYQTKMDEIEVLLGQRPLFLHVVQEPLHLRWFGSRLYR